MKDKATKHAACREHTPGFYYLEQERLRECHVAMTKKLSYAVAYHENANSNMLYAALRGKSPDVQKHYLARLYNAAHRAQSAEKCLTDTKIDLNDTTISLVATNKTPDTAYTLAYCSKLELLKYYLNQIRAK